MKPNSPTISITLREAQDLIAQKLESQTLKNILSRLVDKSVDLEDALKEQKKKSQSLENDNRKLKNKLVNWKRGQRTHDVNLQVLGSAFSLFLEEIDKPGVDAYDNCRTRLRRDLPFHGNGIKTLAQMISKLAKEARNFHPDQDEVLLDFSRLSEKAQEQIKAAWKRESKIKIPSHCILTHPSPESKGEEPMDEQGPEEQSPEQYGGPYEDVPKEHKGESSGNLSMEVHPDDDLPF